MEITGPAALEEESLTESFFLDFTRRVKKVYEYTAPGKVQFCNVKLDDSYDWLIFQFNIAHSRQRDEICIRFEGDKVTVDFLPGGSRSNAVCFIDNGDLRWAMLDCGKACLVPDEREKAKIERIISNVYAIAIHYQAQLQFLIGHSAKVRIGERML